MNLQTERTMERNICNSKMAIPAGIAQKMNDKILAGNMAMKHYLQK
jgi:hypothetical protein